MKFVSRFFASTVAPATLPPFSSRTSPCTVPEVICACPQAAEAKHTPSANTKQAHNSLLIFLSLRPHTPFSRPRSLSQVRGGLRKHLQATSLGPLALKTQEEPLWKLSPTPLNFPCNPFVLRGCTSLTSRAQRSCRLYSRP